MSDQPDPPEKPRLVLSKDELLRLLKIRSALTIHSENKEIENFKGVYLALVHATNNLKPIFEYDEITYKVLYKQDLQKISSLKKDLLEAFKAKMPLILKTDPMVIHHFREHNRAKLEPGVIFCIYRTYEKRVAEYIYFRVLK